MEYVTEIENLISILRKEGGSDLHISAGSSPSIRVAGSLISLNNKEVLTREDTMGLISALLNDSQKEEFLKNQEIDFSYEYNEMRLRCSGFFQRGSVGIALRLIPKDIKTLDELGLPPKLADFAARKQGFFLVVGPVGQGKSTTLASLLEMINTERSEHIVTIEDPIEYVFEQKKSLIDQREVRIDTKDFATALRSIFRQDVNVIMIGEMRGPETMAAAVTAAETGHLVFSTLHTNNAAQTIDRIIDTFPSGQQEQIRIQLAVSLAGIFSQRLIPRISGDLIPAYELLVNNKAVENLIREKRTHELNTVIETGSDEGMIDMNRSLADLVRRGEITIENAHTHSLNPQILEKFL